MHQSHWKPRWKGKQRLWSLVWLAVFGFWLEGATGAATFAYPSLSSASDRDKTSNLKPVKAKELKAILEQKRGKVVLLNFWATWCVPCREEFPELIRLYEQYQPQGLELILVSADDQEQVEQVRAFLKQNRVNFVTYIAAEEGYETLVDFIAPDWIGGLPTTFVFDRRGQLAKSLVGGQNYEVFRKAVASLL